MNEAFDIAMSDIIKALVPVIITALALIIGAVGIKINTLLTEKTNAVTTQIIADYICMVDGYVYDAVLEAEQTIVKQIKVENGGNSLSPTEQEKVRNAVFETVKSNTANNIIETLTQNGIDFELLVNTGIEKTILKLNEKIGTRRRDV